MTWETATARDPIRDEIILIIDDCTLYRENLATTFALNLMAEPYIAWDLPSLISVLQEAEPGIVLLSVAARESALLLRATLDLSPHARVIILGAAEDNEAELIACAEAGVRRISHAK